MNAEQSQTRKADATLTQALSEFLPGSQGHRPKPEKVHIPNWYTFKQNFDKPQQLLVSFPASDRIAPNLTSLVLLDLYFDEKRRWVRGTMQSLLEELTANLESKHGWVLRVETHCDARGSQAYSMTLGKKRAEDLMKYLRDLGIPNEKLQLMNFGKEQPQCQEKSIACWEENIRIQSTFQYMAIKIPQLGCLARLRVMIDPGTQRTMKKLANQTYLQKIHLPARTLY